MSTPKSMFMGEDSSSLASKCMAFCQALASQGQVFTFSLSAGPDFTFSLDTRSKAETTQRTKKKASPSTLRRNARRRLEYNAKKQQSSPSRKSSGDHSVLQASPEKERGVEVSHCELQMSPTYVEREENELSEKEGAAASPVGNSVLPSLAVATSPPAPRVCCFTTTGLLSGPKCEVTYNCEKEFRSHAHQAHKVPMQILENHRRDCECPEC